MGEWSELPPEILYSISLQIDNPFDLIHFRSVCSSWRSSSLSKFRHVTLLRCPLPPDCDGCGPSGDDCHVLINRVYLLKSHNCDCPRYWLFQLYAKENGEFDLHSLLYRTNSSEYGCLHPSLSFDLLNCQIVELAQVHVACYTEWFFTTVQDRIGFMSITTETNEYMILGVLSFNNLAMYRSVDKRWTDLEITPESYCEGIVPFKGKFYAIDCAGTTIVVETTLEVNTFQRSRPCDKTRQRWLVMSGDKLILVEMCTPTLYDFNIQDILEKNIWFEISELNEESNDWVQVQDLNGHVLFLDYCSFSFLATEIPGLKANSILFTDFRRGIIVFEFDEQVVRSLRDEPEHVELFPPGWGNLQQRVIKI